MLIVNQANNFMKRVCSIWQSLSSADHSGAAADLSNRHSCGLYLYYR